MSLSLPFLDSEILQHQHTSCLNPNMTEGAWNFRPPALLDNYQTATINSLMKHFLEDGSRATLNGGSSLPAKPKGMLRICQWNIHFLFAPWLSMGSKGHAQAVADALLDADVGVMVLNEFGTHGDDPALKPLRNRLESAGYTIHAADIYFPTVIATRLPVVDTKSFLLDADRAAVRMTIHANDKTCASEVPVMIYGTHLEASDAMNGKYRLEEAKVLLKDVQTSTDEKESVLIVGDFNQQRQVDYTAEEWEAIAENKAKRYSALDDGVATLLQNAGFQCCYDECDAKKNWKGLPPPTHWSSTVIDYTYSKNMVLDGIYVLSDNLSDHRMIVCDWKVAPATEKKVAPADEKKVTPDAEKKIAPATEKILDK